MTSKRARTSYHLTGRRVLDDESEDDIDESTPSTRASLVRDLAWPTQRVFFEAPTASVTLENQLLLPHQIERSEWRSDGDGWISTTKTFQNSDPVSDVRALAKPSIRMFFAAPSGVKPILVLPPPLGTESTQTVIAGSQVRSFSGVGPGVSGNHPETAKHNKHRKRCWNGDLTSEERHEGQEHKRKADIQMFADWISVNGNLWGKAWELFGAENYHRYPQRTPDEWKASYRYCKHEVFALLGREIPIKISRRKDTPDEIESSIALILPWLRDHEWRKLHPTETLPYTPAQWTPFAVKYGLRTGTGWAQFYRRHLESITARL